MKTSVSLASALLLFLLPLARAEDMDKIAYPTADAPSFIISVPSSWEMTQAKEEGDYFHLHGPTGAVFSFRTIKGSEKALEKAMKDTLEMANDMFTDVKMGDAEDWKPDGLDGFYATGQGKDKDGTPVRIAMCWCALNDGNIAEVWFVADLDDSKGMDLASNIANSLKSP